MARLGDVCSKGSSNIAQKDLNEHNGDFPIYGASGLIKKVDFFQQEKPYIAVVKDGAGIGRVMKLPAKSSVIGTMQYIIPNNNVDIDYLMYAMEHMNLSKYFTGATIPHIYFKDYQKEDLPLPPLDEQRKIAAVLDKVSDLIEKRRQQLDKLDLLIKSKFVEMFGQEKQQGSISDICSIITDGTHQPPKFITNGIPFLFVSNIVSNEITYETEKYISQETYDELIKRTPIEIGDVLLSTVGSYGHPAIVKDSKKFLFQRHIAYLKPKQDMVVSSYLHAALLSYDVQHQIEEKVKGVAQKTLNLSEIRKITLPIPTIERQLSFCKYIEQTEKTKEMIKQSLEKLETLKKALMQKYLG